MLSGGDGTENHAILDNLDYASAGHTGFASTDYVDSEITTATGSLTTDHGELVGLLDDDHTQYHTDGRGDARYYTQAQVDTISGAIDHDTIVNTHNLTTDIDHDALTNFAIGEHRVINDSGTSATELWSAEQIDSEITTATGSYITNIISYDADTFVQCVKPAGDEEVQILVEGIPRGYFAPAAIQIGNPAADYTYISMDDTPGSNEIILQASGIEVITARPHGAELHYGEILTIDETYSGETMTVTVDDGSSVFGSVLMQGADFNYDRADADDAATAPAYVLALEAGSGSKKVLIRGQVCNTAWNWSAGKVYLSETIGGITQTAPSDSGDQVQILGWALSADTIFFAPNTMILEVA